MKKLKTPAPALKPLPIIFDNIKSRIYDEALLNQQVKMEKEYQDNFDNQKEELDQIRAKIEEQERQKKMKI